VGERGRGKGRCGPVVWFVILREKGEVRARRGRERRRRVGRCILVSCLKELSSRVKELESYDYFEALAFILFRVS
jgi:hypothetical protein